MLKGLKVKKAACVNLGHLLMKPYMLYNVLGGCIRRKSRCILQRCGTPEENSESASLLTQLSNTKAYIPQKSIIGMFIKTLKTIQPRTMHEAQDKLFLIK